MRRYTFATLALLLALSFSAHSQQRPADIEERAAALAMQEMPAITQKAQAGDVESQYLLGRVYHLGKPIAKDYAEALKWFVKAAEQWNVGGMNNLASAYYNGKGVARDIVAACMWLQIGAAANDEASINNLAGIKRLLTAEQVAEAQRRAAEWQAQHPRPK